MTQSFIQLADGKILFCTSLKQNELKGYDLTSKILAEHTHPALGTKELNLPFEENIKLITDTLMEKELYQQDPETVRRYTLIKEYLNTGWGK